MMQDTPTIHAGLRMDAPADRAAIDAAYPLSRRMAWAVLAVVAGILIAGFWNAKLADGFGRHVVAGNTVGDTHALANTFGTNGMAFGVLFAIVAGLAATFTACNCVVFAMLPGLTRGGDAPAARSTALRALLRFMTGVVVVGAIYGAYVGGLGRDGAVRLNAVRLHQAEIVFSILGVVLLVWGAIEFGFLRGLTDRAPASLRARLSTPLAKASIMGVIVGLFAVGRPYPVFRDLLTYAATAHNPLYGALVMGLQGLGQVALMVTLFVLLVWAPGGRLVRWAAARPGQAALVTAVALTAGGAYFVYYWGIALVLHAGQWGFRLGLYS